MSVRTSPRIAALHSGTPLYSAAGDGLDRCYQARVVPVEVRDAFQAAAAQPTAAALMTAVARVFPLLVDNYRVEERLNAAVSTGTNSSGLKWTDAIDGTLTQSDRQKMSSLLASIATSFTAFDAFHTALLDAQMMPLLPIAFAVYPFVCVRAADRVWGNDHEGMTEFLVSKFDHILQMF
jgi:hypothetical protein